MRQNTCRYCSALIEQTKDYCSEACRRQQNLERQRLRDPHHPDRGRIR